MKSVMTPKSVCVLVLLLLTACASTPPSAPPLAPPPPPKTEPSAAQPVDQFLVCPGSVDSESYPQGKIPARPAVVLVVLTKDPTLTKAALGYRDVTVTYNGKIMDTTPAPSPICQPKRNNADRCDIKHDGDMLQIHGFVYMSLSAMSLDLNEKTGKLAFSDGGIDGGWAFHGVCRPK